MKKVIVKVIENCFGDAWWYGIYEGKKLLMDNRRKPLAWLTKKAAIRNAKAIAKLIGIPYSDEIIKQHGC